MFDAKNDRTWAGGDQAATVTLPGGQVLWLFGDTVRRGRTRSGARGVHSNMVHNSLLVQTGGCLTAVPGAHGAEAIPTTRSGQWYWPQDAVVTGKTLVVFALRIQKTGPGAFDFASRGVDAAVFTLRDGVPVFNRMAATPSSHAPETADQYGQAFVKDGRWLYVYGSSKVARAFGKSVTVARVPDGHLLDLGRWQYWTGTTWSARRTAASPVVAASPAGWSTSFSVFRGHDGQLQMLAKENDVWGRNIITGQAAAPTAVFSRTVVLDSPSESRPGELTYTALAHPQLPLAGGQLLVTVCRNSSSRLRVEADNDLYKPQFHAIPSR